MRRKEVEEKLFKDLNETFKLAGLAIFPKGCKFLIKRGDKIDVSVGGRILVAIILEESKKRGKMISPCLGCSHFTECKREGILKPPENRLNTLIEEFAPLPQKLFKLFAEILLSDIDDTKNWEFDPDKEEKIPFTCRIIRKRILEENLKIKITMKAYLLLSLWADTPGKAMYLLHHIGNFFEKIEAKEWLLTSEIVCKALFPLGFPEERAFLRWWDNQKQKNGFPENRVDIFPKEWRETNSNNQ